MARSQSLPQVHEQHDMIGPLRGPSISNRPSTKTLNEASSTACQTSAVLNIYIYIHIYIHRLSIHICIYVCIICVHRHTVYILYIYTYIYICICICVAASSSQEEPGLPLPEFPGFFAQAEIHAFKANEVPQRARHFLSGQKVQ